jgi:hypothetical protein
VQVPFEKSPKNASEKQKSPLKGLFGRRHWLGRDNRGAAYCAKAEKARAVISSTLPVPLMARYWGADAASFWAQLA